MGTNQYVAFLRAINVGGRVVKMQEIQTVFESLGLSEWRKTADKRSTTRWRETELPSNQPKRPNQTSRMLS